MANSLCRVIILLMFYGPILKKMIYMKPSSAIKKENEDLEKQVNKLNKYNSVK